MPGSRYKLPIPDSLLGAARDRSLILFIGSGFSKNIDANNVTADGLIEIIAKEVKMDPRLLRIHSNGDWKLCADYLYERRRTLGDALTALTIQLDQGFDSDGVARVSRSQAHLRLAELDLPAIYTTNWDKWIERAFEYLNRSHVVVRSSGDLASPAAFQGDPGDARRPPWIIKFHGDFTQPETIVFKQTDYFRRMRFDDPLDIRLQADIFGHTVLFLGYSFGDPNIQYIWYRMAERLSTVQMPRRCYLLTRDSNPIMESFLNKHLIDIIPVNELDIREATEHLLAELVGVQQQ